MARATDKSQKRGPESVNRTAEEPGQTLNVDLCFVPVEHEAAVKLPAVSGSSGRLVVEKVATSTAEADYPGRVFADESLSYPEAMLEFVRRSEANNGDRSTETEPTEPDTTDVKAQKRALSRAEAALRLERSQLRESRRQQDQAWQHLKAERREQQQERKRPQGFSFPSYSA